jgi:hypothetical protein
MATMHRLFALVGLLAGCLPLGGGAGDGGAGCPDIACGPSYQVKFTRAGTWSSGSYHLEVTANGATGSCDIVMPLSCDHPPRCMGTVNWVPGLVGCALDPGQQSIDGVTFERATPSMVTVRLQQADRTIGMQTFTPRYQTSQGPAACNLSCTQAPTDQMPIGQ